jgi:hypothetical protein
VSAARRRGCVEHVTGKLCDSEQLACRVLGQHRSVPRRALTADIADLAKRLGRYGYRRTTALLRSQGWRCNHMA